jgi:metal-responsive CopG/Arc/MetJ family transcriptional regulator
MNPDGHCGGGVSGEAGSEERLVIEVPGEMVGRLDEVVDLLGFRSREEFALVALKQLLDKHSALMRWIIL